MKTPKSKQDGAFSKSVIVAVLVSVAMFTVAVLVIFAVRGVEPSTLIISVFGFCGCEVGILGWIKSVKEKKDAKAEAEELKNKTEQELE